jgi:hypothetical protein
VADLNVYWGEMESPSEGRARHLTLANLARQGRLDEMRLAGAERRETARRTLASLMKLHGGDLAAVAQGLAEAGYADEAMALTDKVRALEEEKRMRGREDMRDRLGLLNAGAMPVDANATVPRRDVLPPVLPGVPGAVLDVRRPLNETEQARTVDLAGGKFYLPSPEEREEQSIQAAKRRQDALGFQVTEEMAKYTGLPVGSTQPTAVLPGVAAAVARGRAAEAPKPSTGEQRQFEELFLPGWLAENGITNPTAADVKKALFDFKKAPPVAGGDIPLPPEVAAQRAQLNAGSGSNGNAGLVQAVLNNPLMYDDLTPSVKTAISADLAKAGFSGFGRRLSSTEIAKLSDGKSAIASLKDLREVLVANEKHIGPISGLAALNPYSEARKAQADIDRVKQRVGKALEGGVLRKEDEEKYKKILATLTDTPETAIYKVDQIIQNIEQDMSIYTGELRRGGRKVDSGPQAPAGVPAVGGTFNGEKVLKVERVQ